MAKIFDTIGNDSFLGHFGLEKMKTTIILIYDGENKVIFEQECATTDIPNTIDALCVLDNDFKSWYESALEFNKKWADQSYYQNKKFQIDLIIDTTNFDSKYQSANAPFVSGFSSSFFTSFFTSFLFPPTKTCKSKLTYTKKFCPYHDALV